MANVNRYNDFQSQTFGAGYVPYAAVRDRDLDEILEVAASGGFVESQPKAGGSIDPGRALYLNAGRFRVEADWRDGQGGSHAATPVDFSTDDSGLFWFFAPTNWEIMVKVLDGCALNDRFWVFTSATTNVAYTLRVTDTVTGQRREYENAAGPPAPAVTDTKAFATCPLN